MQTPVSKSKIFTTAGWLILRWGILNSVVLILPLFLAFVRHIIENNTITFKFPFHLYFASLVLVNLIYMAGNIFEIVYLKLWNKKIDVRSFEMRFFKAGMVIAFFINAVGVLIYLITSLK